MSFSIRAPMTSIGPVRVRMTGVVSGTEKGPGVGIVNAPTAAEATAELHRVARVSGADRVVSVASDYRRAALAGGTTSTQWRIEVQAWGTAMAPAKLDAGDAAENQDSERTRKANEDQKARDASAKATENADTDTDAASNQKVESIAEPALAPDAAAPAPDAGPATAPVATAPETLPASTAQPVSPAPTDG